MIDAVIAVLNMGNVEFGFVENGDDTPRPSADSREHITTAARLLGVDLAKLVLRVRVVHGLSSLRLHILAPQRLES